METQGEKDSGKNNKNSTVAVFNLDPGFMFIFLYIKGFGN